mmetsp:Transcript_6135/g.12004  ORF Transcript_6135/g.12004 Transcript_6135/m.12004 type:complete len:114 (+) Transcript_6135:2780-3121(+)
MPRLMQTLDNGHKIDCFVPLESELDPNSIREPRELEYVFSATHPSPTLMTDAKILQSLPGRKKLVLREEQKVSDFQWFQLPTISESTRPSQMCILAFFPFFKAVITKGNVIRE